MAFGAFWNHSCCDNVFTSRSLPWLHLCLVAELPGVVDQGLQGERGGGERRGGPAEESHQEERGKSDDGRSVQHSKKNPRRG